MIQVNLLPDLKAEYLKAQRTKRFVMGIAVIASAAAAGLVVIMFLYVNVWQREHTNNLSADIDSLAAEYQGKTDLDKVITVQKQLTELPNLHLQKPLASRLVTYLSVVTPEGPEYRSVSVDFELATVTVVGSAESAAQVNELANSLKNAEYFVGASEGESEVADTEVVRLPAFSDVQLSSLNNDDERVSFSMKFAFDVQIFNNHDEVTVEVPQIDSTNSEVQSPRVEVFESSEEEQ